MSAAPTPADLASMQAHASDNLKIDIIVCSAICGVASLLFILARLRSRMLSEAKLSWSDWLVIIGYVFYLALLGTFVAVIPYGGGRHVIFLTDPRKFSILMICNEVLYCNVMGMIKCSLLAMYGAIFPQRRFHWALWSTTFLVIAWVIYGCFTGIFACVPVHALWEPDTPGAKCITYGTLVVAAGVHNIILDFIILALPIPMVWRLSMSKQKKRLVIFTFAMGGSAVVVSIVRQAYVSKVGSTADPTWDNMPAALVSVAELMAGFLASSIPTYRPLFRHFFSRRDMRSSFPMNDYGSSGNAASRGWPWSHDSKTRSKGSNGTMSEFGGISVTRDIELSTHHQPAGAASRRDEAWIRSSDDRSEGARRADLPEYYT